MKVLLVEGDVSARSSAIELIRGWGHEVEASATGGETLRKVESTRFDLVLVDMDLPDMTAKELIGRLKEINPKIGVVTMTDQSTDELEKQIRTLGIIYYMSKPVNEKALKEILDHMSKKRSQKRIGEDEFNRL